MDRLLLFLWDGMSIKKEIYVSRRTVFSRIEKCLDLLGYLADKSLAVFLLRDDIAIAIQVVRHFGFLIGQ